MSLTTIVFSRDRAAQLDLCLRSIAEHAHLTLGPVLVLYRGTDPAYFDAYGICAAQHPEAVFVNEMDFEADTRAMLAAASGYVTFVMDDDVFYRPIDRLEPPPTELLEANDELLCVSLRLGFNTETCYPLRRDQEIPPFVEEDGDAKLWEWAGADADFGYPGSLDAHVWRLSDLEAMVSAPFVNPNTLEDVLVAGCRLVHAPLMACYQQSSVVGVPANRVSETHLGNRYGETAFEPERLLNAEYLDGRRLSLESIDAGAVTAAHVEFPLRFAA